MTAAEERWIPPAWSVAAGVGIAPTLPVLQAGVQTDYTIQRMNWSFRAVMLRGLSVISRRLCF